MSNTSSSVIPEFSLQRHRFLIDRLQDPALVLSDLRIVYANAAAADALGAETADQLTGKLFYQFLPPEECRVSDAAKLHLLLQSDVRSDPIAEDLLCLDGSRICCQLETCPIDDNGDSSILLLCKQIVPEQSGVRSYASDNTPLSRKIIKHSPEPILIHADGKIHYANQAAARLFRAEYAHELIGRQFSDFFLDDLEERSEIELEERSILNASTDYSLHRMRRLDGEAFYALLSSVVIEDIDQQGSTCEQTVLRDVTGHVVREQELIEVSQRYERLVKFLPEPIVITDMGKIVYCNKSAAKLVRSEQKEDLIGRSIFEFLHPEHHTDSLRVVKEIMHTYDPSPFTERKLICSDGEVMMVEIASIRIDHYNGRSVILSVLRDLTERKQAEELLIRSEKLSVIGQLAAGVAHEIRNPLTSLRGFTQLMRRYLDPAKHYYIETMLSELDRIAYIVNDFMSLSKPQLVAYRLHNISETLRSVLPVIEGDAVLHDIAIDWKDRGGLPLVLCDENRMKQVFLNILKNAIDAMPHGGTIHITTEASMERLYVRIRDEGAGMPKELIDRIGDPFFTTKENGNGLGLMICRRIVEAHHGALHISSTPGEGTMVEIELPLAPIE